jgi:hypothetical protein
MEHCRAQKIRRSGTKNKVMKSNFLVLSVCGSLLIAFITVKSQSSLEIKRSDNGDSYTIDNLLPVAVSAFIVGRDRQANILASAIVTLPARSREHPFNIRGEVVRVEDFEIVHLGAPRNLLPSLFSRGLPAAVAQTDPQNIKEQLRELEISEAGLGDEKIALAAQAAQLWLEQRNDEKDAYRNDPLRREIYRQTMAMNSSPYSVTRRIQEDNARRRNEFMEDVADMAIAYSKAEEAKIEILQREKELYEPLYKNAKTALAFLRQDRKNFEAEIQAGVKFLSITTKLLMELPSTPKAGPAVTVLGELKKSMSGPSGLKDLIEIQATSPANLSVIFAEVRFDNGEEQKTFFRRLSQSNRWAARLYWPLSATSAGVRILSPGQSKWVVLNGRIQADRPSFIESYQKAEKSMIAVIKKYKETSFRAEGADNIKTIPIP